ncbi:MAG: hypothetical protein M1825_001549 [Sarcosagium campestre]|nr:MAG: hypothetical protein M1825_001549 [Sarcosagium campestre]
MPSKDRADLQVRSQAERNRGCMKKQDDSTNPSDSDAHAENDSAEVRTENESHSYAPNLTHNERRLSPRKKASQPVNYREWIPSPVPYSDSERLEESSLGSLDDFIVDDDYESYDEEESSSSETLYRRAKERLGAVREADAALREPTSTPDLEVLGESITGMNRPITPRPDTGPDGSEKLKSPSKRIRVPPSPHRPDSESFWRQDNTHQWYDRFSTQISPQPKRHTKTRNVIVESDEESSDSKRPKPQRRQTQTPSRDAKAFAKLKQEITTNFLHELDQVLTGGELERLAESTGGIKIVWSKTLKTTAGRANWRRERSHAENYAPCTEDKVYKHYASIELSEKIIDAEDRALNVVAHEFCHLATFMISGVKDKPHGKDFKQWAKKCSTTFGARGISVTTKHSYEIDYKYIWNCTACPALFKRHSKSIDPGRHACGVCKAKLTQVKPVPRKTGPSEYQTFVKENFSEVKKEFPGIPQKEVMVIVGQRFRQLKESESQRFDPVVVNGGEEHQDSLAEGESATEAEMPTVLEKKNNVDDGIGLASYVARKLNFLSL